MYIYIYIIIEYQALITKESGTERMPMMGPSTAYNTKKKNKNNNNDNTNNNTKKKYDN